MQTNATITSREARHVNDVVDADPPALRRLAALDGTWVSGRASDRSPTGFRSMGYQPGLDGLRAISVLAVMLYHAGFGWIPGGFFGVEVFFVVSGYLITSLLLEERERDQRVSLERFWLRRARRLFPALVTVLLAVAIWAALFGSHEQQSTLKRDLPWSIFYLGNWGQIFGSTPYFSSADPPLLRHLWSLAVEEQWYVLWPLIFVAAMTIGAGHIRSRGIAFLGASFAIMIGTSIAHGRFSNNTLYLSTITRSSGLLLGAGCAFLWRPWRSVSPSKLRGRRLDPLGAAALTLLVCIMGAASLTAGYVYVWLLPIVSLLSMAVIAIVVYPTARGLRSVLGWKPLVEIGRRSYGLYLWHWPIFVVGHVYHSGSITKFAIGMIVTAAVAEASFRFIETPIRRGFIGDWLRRSRQTIGVDRVRRSRATASVTLASCIVVVGLVAFYASVEHFDAAVGGDEAAFSVPGVADPAGSTGAVQTPVDPTDSTVSPGSPVSQGSAATTGSTSTGGAPTGGAVVPGDSAVAGATETTVDAAGVTPATTATLPRRVVVVGDSQAHSLAINLPDGIEGTFAISDGSVEGCGVYDTGKVVSARGGFNRSFGDCSGWASKWGSAASSADAQVALVVIGAWDVFDLQLSDRTLVFGSPDADAYYVAQLQKGIDALASAGSHVALLEVPCMRPKDVEGAGVPALPERGDDARTGHLNALLRQVAVADPERVTFVAGPAAWCNDESISTNLGYRWDGVHVYKPGANLIYETIAQSLLNIPIPA